MELKKALSLVMAGVMVLSFTACGGDEETPRTPAEEFVEAFVDAAVKSEANSTASSARNNMTYWLAEESMNGRGMASGASEVLFITKNNNGFSCSLPDMANWSGYGSNDEISTAIEALFNEHVSVEGNGAFILILSRGSCERAAFFPDYDGSVNLSDFVNGLTLTGITNNADSAGNIVGTAPQQDYP
jgi:hypothetical protein